MTDWTTIDAMAGIVVGVWLGMGAFFGLRLRRFGLEAEKGARAIAVFFLILSVGFVLLWALTPSVIAVRWFGVFGGQLSGGDALIFVVAIVIGALLVELALHGTRNGWFGAVAKRLSDESGETVNA